MAPKSDALTCYFRGDEEILLKIEEGAKKKHSVLTKNGLKAKFMVFKGPDRVKLLQLRC